MKELEVGLVPHEDGFRGVGGGEGGAKTYLPLLAMGHPAVS